MSRDDRQKRRSRVDNIGCQNDADAEWGDSNLQGFPPPLRVYYFFIIGERSQETQEPSCRTTFG